MCSICTCVNDETQYPHAAGFCKTCSFGSIPPRQAAIAGVISRKQKLQEQKEQQLYELSICDSVEDSTDHSTMLWLADDDCSYGCDDDEAYNQKDEDRVAKHFQRTYMGKTISKFKFSKESNREQWNEWTALDSTDNLSPDEYSHYVISSKQIGKFRSNVPFKRDINLRDPNCVKDLVDPNVYKIENNNFGVQINVAAAYDQRLHWSIGPKGGEAFEDYARFVGKKSDRQ